MYSVKGLKGGGVGGGGGGGEGPLKQPEDSRDRS